MNYIHKNSANSRWFQFSIFEQMANIGTEIGRVIIWKEKDKKISEAAFYRALELLDLTIEDKKNRKHLKELCRLKEMLGDYFMYENIYGSSDKEWENYFYAFNYAAAISRENSNT